jgi:hypothetical protein
MKVNKFTMVLLVGALALPVAGFADGQKVDAPKPVQKPKVVAPADCVQTGKTKAATASAKRKKVHASKGIVSGEEKLVVHNHEAAHEHGRHSNN